MRLFIAFLCVILLVAVATQLRADRPVAGDTLAGDSAEPFIVGTGCFPELYSTIFILGGAAALGLWHAARKLGIV